MWFQLPPIHIVFFIFRFPHENQISRVNAQTASTASEDMRLSSTLSAAPEKPVTFSSTLTRHECKPQSVTRNLSRCLQVIDI